MTTILIVGYAEKPEGQIQGVNAQDATPPMADSARLAVGWC
jgi:hypothetical protein